MENITVRFEFRNSTAGAIRYVEVAPGHEAPHVGALYLKKYTYDKLGQPQVLEATIRPAREQKA